ncbi:MAG: dockerin type I domain-containing protein [Phycisphaerae bacterium]
MSHRRQRIGIGIVATAAWAGAAQPAPTQTVVTEPANTLADDGATDDWFGGAVPIFGTIAIIASDPPDNAIDARSPGGAGEIPGWSAITLTFDGDAAGLTPDDFTITLNPDDTTPPQVVSVETDGANATLAFDVGIPVLHWTNITHIPSNTGTRIGFLPGDVNNDRTSDANDILTIIDHLNGAIDPLQPYQFDIGRDGLFNASDVLLLIDLLNGGGAFGPWYGATLPD